MIEVAIVRPGPIQGGMVHPYLRRRAAARSRSIYPSEELKPVLERTLGVPIFQEQVMQIAMVAAGFTPGEADQLRRAMAAWKRKGGLEQFHERLVERHASSNGYDARVRRSASSSRSRASASTAFPESHAASFALLVYVERWLKCHHPAAFLRRAAEQPADGLLRAGAAGAGCATRTASRCCRSTCAISDWDSRTRRVPAAGAACLPVRLGLDRMRGLRRGGAQRIVDARAQAARSRASKTSRGAPASTRTTCEALAQADALRRSPATPPGRVGGRRRRDAADRDCCARRALHEAPVLLRRAERSRGHRWPTTARSA